MANDDAILFSMFPEGHAVDLTKEPATRKQSAPKSSAVPQKPAKKSQSADASWEPVKAKPTDLEKVKACVLNAAPSSCWLSLCSGGSRPAGWWNRWDTGR